MYVDLGLVLHVQKMWGDCRSPASSLSYNFGAMEYSVLLIWPSLGYANDSCSYVFVCSLAGVFRQA